MVRCWNTANLHLWPSGYGQCDEEDVTGKTFDTKRSNKNRGVYRILETFLKGFAGVYVHAKPPGTDRPTGWHDYY
ncbi:MAG: hypothetical protein ACM3X1_00765 [Ignavibacteriales bacterium]